MKETFYFSHDYNARTDEKIKKLIKKHGMAGYGIFWSIVEDLYNNANVLRTDYDGIAYDLRSENGVIKSIINDFDLFGIEDDFFGSESIERRLDERSERSEKARQKAFKRWRKDVNDDPTVLASDAIALKNDATVTKTDAGKESKGKDIKGEDIKGYKNKNSRKNREDFFSDPDKESEERKEEEQSRVHVKGAGLESNNYNYSDLIGSEELGDMAEPDFKPVLDQLMGKESKSTEKVNQSASCLDNHEPQKSAESKNRSTEPIVEKIRVPDWDD